MIKETNYAIFNYQKVDESLINDLILYFDNNIECIFDFFDIHNNIEKAIIHIIPTKKEYDEIFMKEYPWSRTRGVSKSSRGICRKDGSIVYLSINDYQNTTHAYKENDFDEALDGFKKTLIHEYVHYINKQFNIKYKCYTTAKYLREGIATYLSKQKGNDTIMFNFSIEDLLVTDSNKSCYDGYYLITKFLIENYDKKFILKLFKNDINAEEFLIDELYNKAKSYYLK